MAQRSQFYDSTTGDRVYGSDRWAQIVAALMGTGVVADIGSELAVVESSPPAMSVNVGLGVAFVQGHYVEVYNAAETLAIAAADASNPRIDRVVVRRSLANRETVLAVLTGTPAASPTLPALTQDPAGTYEIPLAQVRVNANVLSIVNADITDERGQRARGTDIADILDAATGHRHEGVDGTGRKVRLTDLDGVNHKARHASAGADPLTPADIGAVAKSGDTMTGLLTLSGQGVLPHLDGQAIDNGTPPGNYQPGYTVFTFSDGGVRGFPAAQGTLMTLRHSDNTYAFQIIGERGADTFWMRRGTSLNAWGVWRRVLSFAEHDTALAGHHAESHETRHRSGGADQLLHQNLGGRGANDHHAQLHASTHTTGQPDAMDVKNINGFARGAAGSTVGQVIFVGNSDPGASSAEGDIWIKG